MVDESLPGLCTDCRDQRQQRVEAVTAYRGLPLCASCKAERVTDDQLDAAEIGRLSRPA